MDKETYDKVIKVMDEFMVIDKYNDKKKPYTIANIYYDTNDDYLIRNSLSKPVYKEKLRLRSYGVPDEETKVFLEIKKKYKGIVNKRRTALTLKEAYDFVETGKRPEYKEYMNRQVRHEISYFLKVYDVEPKLYLAYDRVAYFDKNNKELRISFDSNIRTRRYDLALEKGDYGKSLLDKDTYLMEIKTSMAMPLWLTHMLNEFNLSKRSFSKYGAEFKRQIV